MSLHSNSCISWRERKKLQRSLPNPAAPAPTPHYAPRENHSQAPTQQPSTGLVSLQAQVCESAATPSWKQATVGPMCPDGKDCGPYGSNKSQRASHAQALSPHSNSCHQISPTNQGGIIAKLVNKCPCYFWVWGLGACGNKVLG